jgi:amidase
LRLVTPRVCDPHGRKLETCIDWIAPTFLVTLVSLPAGLAEDGRPVGLQIVVPRSRSR